MLYLKDQIWVESLQKGIKTMTKSVVIPSNQLIFPQKIAKYGKGKA